MSSTESKDRGTVMRGAARRRRLSQLPRRPFHPEFWRSPLRGPWLTSFLGTLLVPGIVVMTVTGFISHWAYHPELAGNATVNPAYDIPALFQFPASWPSWDYAVTQGTHVTLGLVMLPLVLAKLWSVIPKLFQRPAVRSVASAIERISMLLLVGSVLVEFATGVLAMQNESPPGLNFYYAHYYGAWVLGTMFLLHTFVKLPTVRQAYRDRGFLTPLRAGLRDTTPEPPDAGGLSPVSPAAPTISRRGLLAMVGGASLTIFAVQVGETIGGPLRRFALLAPRGRVFGTGPNDFEVTNTAASAQITPEMTGAAWRLSVVGAHTLSLTREQLLAMTQHTYALTITCTDGWSTTQRWSGVRLVDLAELVDAPAGAVLRAESLELAGRQIRFAASEFSDERSLLALRVNGVDISADHGYPARVILSGVPGDHNTKWVRELAFEAA